MRDALGPGKREFAMPGGVAAHGPVFREFGDVNGGAAKGRHFRALIPRASH